jgi:DDE family transposase/transposase-like protein DUF772
VQGRSGTQRDLWDVESVVGHLLPAGSVFAFLAEHRQRIFPDEMFADLFPSGRGRPSVPAPVVASVLVLQALHGSSDREAADAVTFDLRWKAACGLPVTAGAFHPTTLTYWRARLAASQAPDRIFEAVREVIAASGVLRGNTRRALDSTILDDAVATQDTVTQLIAAVRRVARVVPGGWDLVKDATGGDRGGSGHDYASTGKPRIGWDDEQARADLVDALVRDAIAVLAGVQAKVEVEDLQDGQIADAVGLLALIARQDVEYLPENTTENGTPSSDGGTGGDGGGVGRWRIAQRVAPDRVISTVDPEARHAHKTTSRRQDGFKAHVIVEPDTGLVTACAVTRASGEGSGDATAGIDLLNADTTLRSASAAVGAEPNPHRPHDLAAAPSAVPAAPVQVLGDSAYGTGQVLAAVHAAGHDPVIKPWPVNSAVPGGFTVDDFTVSCNEQDRPVAVTCPAGITRPVNTSLQVNFGAACRTCPLKARCTTSRTGKSMRLREHDALQRAHRRRAATDPEFAADYRRWRPMVERSLAWLTRGNRRVPYRGVAKNNAWFQLRATAVNLHRMITLGLVPAGTGWAITS